MNNVLDYYFVQEFQWRTNWFSNEGIIKPVIRASHEVLRVNFVDYSILEGVFSSSKVFNNRRSCEELISELRKELEYKGIASTYNEIVGLKIKPDFCVPIDNLGSKDGLEAPLSWNIATPEHLQRIPTVEIFGLFDDWLQFLKVLEENPLRID